MGWNPSQTGSIPTQGNAPEEASSERRELKHPESCSREARDDVVPMGNTPEIRVMNEG